MRHLRFLIVLVLAALVLPVNASALSGSSFKAGRIMDDSVFFNGSAMSVTQIQNFLNSKVPTCDTNHAKTSSSNDSGPPYTCLKDYKSNITAKAAESGLCDSISAKSNQSAAQIIYTVGKACNVSQKVILVTLQKEQGLVTDTWPWDIQYKKAMGYGCPDTAPCDTQYYGFFNQVYMAARQFKRYAKFPDSYNYQGNVTGFIQWHPNASCGGSNVALQNQATAGLYNYTPYQPNKAALDNLYGTGSSCSSYGNRNFWRYYNDWFGLTTAAKPYAWKVISNNVYADSARTQRYTTGINSVAPSGTLYVTLKLKNAGGFIWESPNARLGTAMPNDRSSIFADGSWIGSDNNRPAAMVESQVYPGDTATFNFSMKAPSTVGYYVENFGFVQESSGWASGHLTYPIQVVQPTSPASTSNQLTANALLSPGQSLLSTDKKTILVFQRDGNVVLYKDFRPLWSTKTGGKNAKKFIMQGDGNLVLYDANNHALWSSQTFGNNGAYFIVQTDGNSVIYSGSNSPLWSSGTYRFADGLNYVVNTTNNSTVVAGQSIMDPSRKYQLTFQGDGNLVLYDQGTAIWSSKTYGHPESYLVMQGDGNLVIYDKNGKAIWSSKTNGNKNASLTVQGDRNVVIYNVNNKPIWSSKTAL